MNEPQKTIDEILAEGEVSERETALPRFSLQRRITVLVLLLTVMVVGTIATWGIPLELFPRGWDPPFLGVSASWRDAPPQDMLDKVTMPLEDEISTIPGLQNMFSFTRTGRAFVRISFKGSADVDVVYRELRDRIERARSRMPDDVDRILIQSFDDSQIPVLAFGIQVEKEVLDAYDLIQNEIVMPIERVDGVGNVEVQGLEPKEVLIELDRARTEAAGLDIFSIGQDLQRDNFTMASGHVQAAERKLLLRSVARYDDLEALAARQVARGVRLGDIATITYDEAEKLYRVRSDGKPAYFAIVRKESEANAIDVSRRLTKVLDGLGENPRLGLVGVEVFFDQGSAILDSLDTLLESGQIGAVFAALVLFFFLRRFRMTLIISLAIPLSMFMGMTTMFFLGESLNVLTLLGLMISVGLLVDNSVVVAENIFRLHRDGVPRREAAVRGTGQISLAIVMATLTTVVVFLPVSLVDGPGRFFLLRLSIPITASLLASLFVALVFVPLACYLTLPSRAKRRESEAAGPDWHGRLHAVLRHAYERTVGRLEGVYHRVLAGALRRRVDLAMAATLVVVATVAVPVQQVEMAKTSEEDHGGIELNIFLPDATTLKEADAYFQQAERILEQKRDEWDLATTLVVVRRSYGEIQAWFNVPRTNEVTDAEVREQLSQMLPEKGGVRIYTGLEDETQEETKELYNLTLTGDDWRQLEEVALGLEEVLVKFDGVTGIKRSGEEDRNELGVSIDREQAQRLGIEPTTIAGVVRNSLGGAALPKIYREGREIPVRVRFREEDREDLSQLMDFRVPTASGQAVALSSVASTQRLESAGRISRTNRQISRSITLELADDEPQQIRRNLDRLTAGIDLPEGVRFGQPRRGSSSSDEVKSMAFAALLSVVFIYLLMGFLFESFILPLSIVTTIPLAILGVYWGHFIFGVDMDLLGMVGIVLLIGVVVNNGIVLVDYTNRLRDAGRRRAEAVLDAARRRFRPIMMTALTTISGMFPLLLGGQGELGMSYDSFAVTLIGGMAVATLLTLLVVPVVYTVFDDLRILLSSSVARLAQRKPRGEKKAIAEA
ncbi:MAG: efflux RND transporter permease subunit [Thermoanaerobaculia bacterium]|nr:efflux RND transporter permease subunit [Thermoanaerobaculia bacterium]